MAALEVLLLAFFLIFIVLLLAKMSSIPTPPKRTENDAD